MNVIVPSGVGDHVGLAVVRSLGKRHIPMTVVSNNKYSMPFYSKYCSNKIVTEYSDDFLCELTEDDIIMPNGEDEMLFFAKHAPFYDYSLAYPDISTLEKIFDKSQLMRYAISHHIPVPQTFFPTTQEEIFNICNSLNYPVIIKPNEGQGGRGIALVHSADMLEKMFACTLQHYGPSIVQEFVPFKKRYSAAVLVNDYQEIQRMCVIKEHRIYPHTTGTACFVETVENPDILDLTSDILKHLNVWGVCQLDFIIDERDGKPKFLEMNPRFWGSVQCAISAGVDFPFLLHEIVVGNTISVSYEYQTGLRCRNVVCNDIRNLLAVLRGVYPFSYKLKAAINFMKFYQDDAYYIFSLSDLRPFLSIFEYYLLRKRDLVCLNNSGRIYK